jgi:hypothetical protein
VAVVQYTFTHKQYTEYRERNIQNTHTHTHTQIGKCGPCPDFASYTLAFALQLRKKHGEPSVRVVEKWPDIPVAVTKPINLISSKKADVYHSETCQMYIAQFDSPPMTLSYLQKVEFEELIIKLQYSLDRKGKRENDICSMSQIYRTFCMYEHKF